MLSVSNIVELLKQHNCKMTVILLTEDMCEKKIKLLCKVASGSRKGKGLAEF